MKNCAIITSVVAPDTNAPLSYANIRSVYSVEDRLNQTMDTLKTLRNKIPDIKLLMVECSPISWHTETLRMSVGAFYNIYPNDDVRLSPHKGWSEAVMLLHALDKFEELTDFDNIFKVSARYTLNEHFKYEFWENPHIVAKQTDLYGSLGVHTCFYKFPKNKLQQYREIIYDFVCNPVGTAVEEKMLCKIKPLGFINVAENIGMTARWSCYTVVNNI